MELEGYIKERNNLKSRKYKTINIDADLHLFLKRTASHYNIAMADLMYNILSQWKDQFDDEILNDKMKDFK